MFTPEEANKALPEIRLLVSSVMELKKKLDLSLSTDRRADLDKLSLLVSKINARGVELKDLDMGLIDFPAMRFSEPVYLCWKPGEEEVMYWHKVSEGFRGRKLLKPEPNQIL